MQFLNYRPETHEIVLLIWCGLFLLVAWKLTAKDDYSYWKQRLKLIPLALIWFVIYVFGDLIWRWLIG